MVADPCLAFSSHHLEYGFPSTHTTNSISIALVIYSHVHRLYFSESSISSSSHYISLAAIIFYAFSIVFGRIYAAMHSFTDCAFGVILGAAIWALQHLYLERIEEAIVNGGWMGESWGRVLSEVLTRHKSTVTIQFSPHCCDINLLAHG